MSKPSSNVATPEVRAALAAGVKLHQAGRLVEAAAEFARAAALAPGWVDPLLILAETLELAGDIDGATQAYLRAIELDPAAAHIQRRLGEALTRAGRLELAMSFHQQAIQLDQAEGENWASFARYLGYLAFVTLDPPTEATLETVFAHPAVPPDQFAATVTQALRVHPAISPWLGQSDAALPAQAVGRLAASRLLIRLLGTAPVAAPWLEQILTQARATLLNVLRSGGLDEAWLPFAAALAVQCFVNEYVFAESAAERAIVDEMAGELTARLADGQRVEQSLVLGIALYRPLYRLPGAAGLLGGEGPLAELLRIQVAEPLEEQALKSQIATLAPIADPISQAVQAQYEDNPYPRWVRAETGGKPAKLAEIFQRLPGASLAKPPPASERLSVLIAGCGTGRQVLGALATYKNAHIHAADLSLTSLAYARRMLPKSAARDVEFAQADILDLGLLKRRFDVVESSGVLHHMPDPLAGWRVLADLLRPGGFMRIGLYSATARRIVVEAREWIASQGLGSSPQDIRRLRQEIKALPPDHKLAGLASIGDFYSMSNCRDLLFHVQEHRFTLPEIDEALRELGLAFLGFEGLSAGVVLAYQRRFPADATLTSLEHWHAFEQENPDSFIGMYKLCLQKR